MTQREWLSRLAWQVNRNSGFIGKMTHREWLARYGTKQERDRARKENNAKQSHKV